MDDNRVPRWGEKRGGKVTSFILCWLGWKRRSVSAPFAGRCSLRPAGPVSFKSVWGIPPSLSKHDCLVSRDKRQGRCPAVQVSLCSEPEAQEIAQEMWCLKSQHHKLSPSDCCDCISGFYPLGYFQRCHQTKPLPRVSAPLLLERAAVRPHPLWAVLQRRVWSKGRVRKALVGGGRGKLDGAAPFRGMIGSELCVQCGEREREREGCRRAERMGFYALFCSPPPRPVLAFWKASGLPAQDPACVVTLPATCCWLFWFMLAPQIQSFNSNENIYWGPPLCQVL